jgi:hypothetical protein
MSTSQEETKALFRKQWSGPAGRIGPQHPAVALLFDRLFSSCTGTAIDS